MNLFDEILGLMYQIRGHRVPRVELEVFAPRFAELVQSMLPTSEILRLADVDLTQGWSESFEQEIIEAHVAHLLHGWQPAHNSLADIKPGRQYARLHARAFAASRAYGETIVTYIEYKRLFLSPQYLTKVYYRKERDGKQWDSLARERIAALLEEINRIEVQEPHSFRMLIPSDDDLDRLGEMASEGTDFLLFGSFSKF